MLLDYARPSNTLTGVRVDRLGRSLNKLLVVVDQLKARGVAFKTLEELLDTSSAAGELVFHVFGAIAQCKRWLIAERTRDGIAAARAKGKHPGRQPVGRDTVAAALELVEAGLSPTQAAKQRGLSGATAHCEMALAGVRRVA